MTDRKLRFSHNARHAPMLVMSSSCVAESPIPLSFPRSRDSDSFVLFELPVSRRTVGMGWERGSPKHERDFRRSQSVYGCSSAGSQLLPNVQCPVQIDQQSLNSGACQYFAASYHLTA